MYHGGRKPTLHLIDGQPMTVDQIAAMLGVTTRAIQCRRSRMGGVSYQLIVDTYRENQFNSVHDKWPRHLVDGEWITTRDAAQRVGVETSTITRYMRAHGVTLGEAMNHYRKYQTGELKRWPGRMPRTYYVNGKLLTIRQAADKYNTTENSLRLYIFKHKCSLQTAVRQLEERRKRQAERDILSILGF